MRPVAALRSAEPHRALLQPPVGALADVPERLESAYSAAREQGADANAHDGQPGTVAMHDQDLKPGDIVSDWKIERFVAAGGMGEVFEVRGTLGGLRGALKRIRPELLMRPGVERRFEAEVEILAALACPHIVRLLHAGKHEGSPYLVMEWLDGMTLRDFMNHRRQPIPLAEALHYATRIAVALCAAHARGVLHRDLKPENIFMLERGTLKVLDFGLGKLAGTDRVSTSELAGMCTVHYAAPEQLERTGVDDRTDVRAAALIFVEMVTLRWAFADRPHVLPPREIARANQLLAEPPSLHDLLPGCPDGLAALIDAALSRDKTKRPRSTEFLAGLRDARLASRGPNAPVLTVNEVDEEDSVDEAAPATAPAEPTDETSDIRVIRQLRTETLPPGYLPADPTAAANDAPLPPPIRTVKMARPTAAALDARRAEVAQEAARRIEDTTGGSRAALLPVATAATATPSGVSMTQAPVQPTPQAPARGTMPRPHELTPPGQDESATTRASLEFASRPTLPWQRTATAREGSSSLSPIQQGLPSVEPAHRRRIPLWTAPLLGVVLTVVPFMIGRSVLSRSNQDRPHEQPGASTSADVTPTGSATSVPASPADAPADMPAATTSAAEAEAATPAPATSASAALTTSATAMAPPTSTPRPSAQVAPRAVTTADARAKRAYPPKARSSRRPPTAQPQPAAVKVETPPTQPTAARNRLFGADE